MFIMARFMTLTGDRSGVYAWKTRRSLFPARIKILKQKTAVHHKRPRNL